MIDLSSPAKQGGSAGHILTHQVLRYNEFVSGGRAAKLFQSTSNSFRTLVSQTTNVTQ